MSRSTSGWRRAGLIALALTIGAVVLAACGSDEGGSSGSSASTDSTASGAGQGGAPLTLGASFTNFSPYYVVMNEYVKKELERIGGSELEPAANNFDPGKQITDIRNLITAGANGLFVTPADSKALGSAIDFANEKKASIVIVDDTVDGGGVFMNVKADNKKMAEQACEAMGEAIGGKGKVLSLEGDQATQNGRDRTEGFKDCMTQKFPEVEVIGRPTDWSTEKAANATQTVLTANPDLAGVYMQSDTLFLAPVESALKKAGNTSVKLVGIDGTPQTLDGIRDGSVYATVSQPIELYAKYGVLYNQAAQDGETFSPGPTDHESEIVDINGTLTDLLPAPLVTAENVDEPTLWGNSPAAQE